MSDSDVASDTLARVGPHTLNLAPEEVDLLGTGDRDDRCPACGHLQALHYDDDRYPFCGISGCPCHGGEIRDTAWGA